MHARIALPCQRCGMGVKVTKGPLLPGVLRQQRPQCTPDGCACGACFLPPCRNTCTNEKLCKWLFVDPWASGHSSTMELKAYERTCKLRGPGDPGRIE